MTARSETAEGTQADGVHLRLTNGWTLSLTEDCPPALLSAAAWPTADDNKHSPDTRWHEFRNQGIDARIFGFSGLVTAFREVMALKGENEEPTRKAPAAGTGFSPAQVRNIGRQIFSMVKDVSAAKNVVPPETFHGMIGEAAIDIVRSATRG